ncbi:MAG: hypothetical protein L0220_16605, partial [Acidobacteria bacterium]|nr:hypothetical protein [Acidobacteriota bacterium]
MRIPRQVAHIVAFILIALSFPRSLFSLTPPEQYQPKHPQRVDALAVAINELLGLDPIEPGQTGELVSSADTSEGEEKPPADDAPIKEIVAYWSGYSYADKQSARKPSDKVRERLLEAVESRPRLIFFLSNFIPQTTDTHDRLYKLLEEGQENELYWVDYLRKWLRQNSRYFRDELIEAARNADEDRTDAEENLQALARIDWETAKPILETFASSGIIRLKSIALSLLYQNTHQNNDSVQAENYRVPLQAIVANRESPPDARMTALSSLVATEWNEQMEWVVSLFADPTLNNLHEVEEEMSEFGILANLLDLNPEKWLDVVSNLVGHHDRTVHESAIRCLVKLLSHEEIDINKKREVEEFYSGYSYYQYLRLTREGGRRIILRDLQRMPKNPTLHEELSGLFYRLSRSGEFTIRYAIEDKIPAVEILLADKNQKTLMVCGEGRDIRVLVQEREVGKISNFAELEPEWREFSSNGPVKVTGHPSACRGLSMISAAMMKGWKNHYGTLGLPTRSGDAWVYHSYGKDPGIWQIEPGAEPVMILGGPYTHPLITPDGKWLVAVKSREEGDKYFSQLVRRNLLTGKEFTVDTLNDDVQ